MVEMVERLHSIPPHTAAVERFYSRLGFMQGPRRSNLSVKMLTDMAMVNAWLAATDPSFGKPPRTASKRVPTYASGDRQEHATADIRSDENDGGGDDNNNNNEGAILSGEDSPEDAGADNAAAAASNGHDEESWLCAESAGGISAAPERPASKRRRTARSVESASFMAMRTCDLTSPFLLAGIHGNSVAQEAPTREAPQTSTDNDGATRTVEVRQWLKCILPDG
jgi:hypothetical protein